MSPELGNVRPAHVVSALVKAGLVVKRQTGSHVIMYKPGTPRPVTVPMHRKDLPIGTIRAIIRQAGLTVDEFVNLL